MLIKRKGIINKFAKKNSNPNENYKNFHGNFFELLQNFTI